MMWNACSRNNHSLQDTLSINSWSTSYWTLKRNIKLVFFACGLVSWMDSCWTMDTFRISGCNRTCHQRTSSELNNGPGHGSKAHVAYQLWKWKYKWHSLFAFFLIREGAGQYACSRSHNCFNLFADCEEHSNPKPGTGENQNFSWFHFQWMWVFTAPGSWTAREKLLTISCEFNS